MDGKAEHCKQEKSKNKITGITERRERMTEWKTERKIAKRKQGWKIKQEIRTSEQRMQERNRKKDRNVRNEEWKQKLQKEEKEWLKK